QLPELTLVLRRTREHRAPTHLAIELAEVATEVEHGARPREERRLGEADRQTAFGDVVDERAERGGLPEERDETSLGQPAALCTLVHAVAEGGLAVCLAEAA